MSEEILKDKKDEIEKPWEKRKNVKVQKEYVDGTLNIVIANRVFIKKQNVKARMLNQFQRLAAFSNPEFYKKQAMGFSIQSGSDTENYVCLPRGCKDRLLELL